MKPGSLRDNRRQQVLNRLHDAARGDKLRFLGLVPRLLFGLARGKPFQQIVTVEAAKNIYMPVSPEQGRFMYQTARAIGAKSIVEFGTSFGISTIYLAAAVADNNGDIVVGTEMAPNKHAQAISNLAEAGLDAVTEVRLGDALETLKDDPASIDMVLLDGWKDLYMPVLELLKPRLNKGAVILADNIYTFKKSLRPYVEYMQSAENGFESITLPLGDGMEYSIFLE